MQKNEFLKKLNSVFDNLSLNPDADVFRVIGEEFGYFDLPKKRSIEELTGYTKLYRGFKKEIFIEQILTDADAKNFFIGDGEYGRGIYGTELKFLAQAYTCERGISNIVPERVLKFYIKDCNIIEHIVLNFLSRRLTKLFVDGYDESDEERKFVDKQLEELNDNFRLEELINKVKTLDSDKIKRVLLKNTSALAILLGYDVVDLSLYGNPNFLVLNRGKIHVLDRDFEKFTGKLKSADLSALKHRVKQSGK